MVEKGSEFQEFKKKLYDFHNIDDLNNYIKEITSLDNSPNINEFNRQLINSFKDTNLYKKKLSFDFLQLYFKIFNNLDNRQDANKLIVDIYNKTDDISQINTFRRIIKMKSNSDVNDNINKLIIFSKNCPHCNKTTISNNTTKNIICGYTNKGFDWKGCGNDWCFQCGKKLCKNWEKDSLFTISNRNHDTKCCKNHAASKNSDYLKEYCQCE